MKILILSTLLFFNFISNACASRDSIGFFYRSEKVDIVLTERSKNGRIPRFMDYLLVNNSVFLENNEKTIKLGCAREENRSSCTFTFYPHEAKILIKDKTLIVSMPLDELGLISNGDFEMYFEGSMNDKMFFEIKNNILSIEASKLKRLKK